MQLCMSNDLCICRNKVTTISTTSTTATTTTTATSKTTSYDCYEVTWKLKGANVTEDLPNYADAIVSEAEPKDLDEFIREHIGNKTGDGHCNPDKSETCIKVRI